MWVCIHFPDRIIYGRQIQGGRGIAIKVTRRTEMAKESRAKTWHTRYFQAVRNHFGCQKLWDCKLGRLRPQPYDGKNRWMSAAMLLLDIYYEYYMERRVRWSSKERPNGDEVNLSKVHHTNWLHILIWGSKWILSIVW